MTTPPRRPTPASRATRRSRRPPPRSATFLERNRRRLLWGGGILVFVLLVGMAFLGFTRPTYACLEFFDPTPAPSFVAPTAAPASGSPAPTVTAPTVTAPPPGLVQPDMGHVHADPGTTIRYTSCPPASGRHYNASGIGPIRAGYYGPNDTAVPPGWVHNLEHGGIVLLYSCAGPGDSGTSGSTACTEAGQVALQALLATLACQSDLQAARDAERGHRPLRRHGLALRRPRLGRHPADGDDRRDPAVRVLRPPGRAVQPGEDAWLRCAHTDARSDADGRTPHRIARSKPCGVTGGVTSGQHARQQRRPLAELIGTPG